MLAAYLSSVRLLGSVMTNTFLICGVSQRIISRPDSLLRRIPFFFSGPLTWRLIRVSGRNSLQTWLTSSWPGTWHLLVISQVSSFIVKLPSDPFTRLDHNSRSLQIFFLSDQCKSRGNIYVLDLPLFPNCINAVCCVFSV